MKAEVRLALIVLLTLWLLKGLTTQNYTCRPGMFRCHSTPNTCIPVASRCNFLVDCEDSSDEVGCACTDQRYTCNFSEESVCTFKHPNDSKKWTIKKQDALPPDLQEQSRGPAMILEDADMFIGDDVNMTQTITGYHEPRTLRLLYSSSSKSKLKIRYGGQWLFDSQSLNIKSMIWTPINVSIPTQGNSSSKLELTYLAVGQGKQDDDAYMAIDDVEITHSRCPIDTTTTTTTTTATTTTASTTTTPAECQDGTFGLTCTKTCHCSDQNEICHKITGRCNSGCLSGWKGSDCQQRDCAHKAYCGIHTCHELDQNYNCSCLDGYENSDSQHCEDIDECEQDNICDIHTCMNLNGSFDCICNNGSYENIDHQICVIRISGMNNVESVFLILDIKVMVIQCSLSITAILYMCTVWLLCAHTVARALHRWCTTIPATLYTRRMYHCPYNSPASFGEISESEDDTDDNIIDDWPEPSNDISIFRYDSDASFKSCLDLYESRPSSRKVSSEIRD